jgi:hypothetical protein
VLASPGLGSFSQSRLPQLWACGLKNRVHALWILHALSGSFYLLPRIFFLLIPPCVGMLTPCRMWDEANTTDQQL